MISKYKMRLEKLVSSVIHQGRKKKNKKKKLATIMSLLEQGMLEAEGRAAALGLVGSGTQDLLHKVFVGQLLSASDHKTTNLML